MSYQPFRENFDNTRMGEMFAGMELRAEKSSPEQLKADKDSAQMMVAGAFMLEYLTGVIAREKLAGNHPLAGVSKGFDSYLQFLVLIRPDWFETEEMSEKTRKTILMVYKDMQDAVQGKKNG